MGGLPAAKLGVEDERDAVPWFVCSSRVRDEVEGGRAGAAVQDERTDTGV